MSKTNIIQRRDLDPLWRRATKVARHYERASNCIAAVIGADCISVEYSKHPKAILFCSLCKRYHNSAVEMAPHEYPCSSLHLEALGEARKLGGTYVYTCPAGFFFWTSPFFFRDRFAGALTSSSILSVDRQKVQDKLFKMYRGEISHEKIAQYLEGIPEKSGEEIKSLAQMMMLCTEQISCNESRQDTSAVSSGGHQCPDSQANIMDLERALVASLRRGDSGDARSITRDLLDKLSVISNSNFETFKLKVIELVVMLSRTGANSENNEDIVEANNRYLKRVEDSKTTEEITENLYLFLQRMVGKMFSFQGVRHASALRKAERFIWENYTRKISLKEIAAVSGLSAPYFSTIFKDEMGENLSNHLNRLRVEKASSMLMETDLPINEISTACGFEDQSWFSKIFKIYTGSSPYRYREHGEDGFIKPGRCG